MASASLAVPLRPGPLIGVSRADCRLASERAVLDVHFRSAPLRAASPATRSDAVPGPAPSASWTRRAQPHRRAKNSISASCLACKPSCLGGRHKPLALTAPVSQTNDAELVGYMLDCSPSGECGQVTAGEDQRVPLRPLSSLSPLPLSPNPSLDRSPLPHCDTPPPTRPARPSARTWRCLRAGRRCVPAGQRRCRRCPARR